MAAPVGSVWLADKQRYRTEEEQTEGQMPENVWLIGYLCGCLGTVARGQGAR